MATQFDRTKLDVLKQANVPASFFARYTGIHRVTVASWLRGTNSKPRALYWERALQVLGRIEALLADGKFPMRDRADYKTFAAALDA